MFVGPAIRLAYVLPFYYQ